MIKFTWNRRKNWFDTNSVNQTVITILFSHVKLLEILQIFHHLIPIDGPILSTRVQVWVCVSLTSLKSFILAKKEVGNLNHMPFQRYEGNSRQNKIVGASISKWFKGKGWSTSRQHLNVQTLNELFYQKKKKLESFDSISIQTKLWFHPEGPILVQYYWSWHILLLSSASKKTKKQILTNQER